MPLLKAKPSLDPDGIFALDPESFPWHVAHVRSGQEKSLARRLHALATAYFLPQVKKLTRGSGRDFVSHLPLIPGYLFFRGEHEIAGQALKLAIDTRNIIPCNGVNVVRA